MLDRMFLKQQGGGAPLYVEDVFSTWLYTGNGSAQTIDNGIELGSARSSGGYITLNGTNYLKSPSSSAFAFGTGDFTMEAWIYPTSVSGTTGVVSTRIDASAADNQVFFGIAAGQVLYYASVSTSGGTVAANNWYHIACSRSGTTVRIFLNGVQVGTVTDSVSKTTTFGFVGSGSGDVLGQVFDGRISNARIVKGTALYTSNFTPSTTPLTAVSGTSLLTCQAPNLTADNSTNAFTLTQIGTISTSVTGGPFPDATKGKGGMAWIKTRNTAGVWHNIYDTARGTEQVIFTNSSDTQNFFANTLTAFNSNGFSVGSSAEVNGSGSTYASWTFREAPKFFDVVRYTGNGANRNIAHNLGVAPGMIIVKRTDAIANWQVYHRSLANTEYMVLNSTAGVATGTTRWNSTTPTATEFTVGTDPTVNASGATYVAYLYAHDTASTGLIQCGTYTGNGSSTGPVITLGWEAQWVLIKKVASGTLRNWLVADNMRALPAPPSNNANVLQPNVADAEIVGGYAIRAEATGFSLGAGDAYNGSGETYIYMAIRRGPMKTPTVGTSVFTPISRTGTSSAATVTTSFTPDFVLTKATTGTYSTYWWNAVDRLRGVLQGIFTNATTAETAVANGLTTLSTRSFSVGTDFNYNDSGTTYINYTFGRAPGFFDEVCYTGTSLFAVSNHNLGVQPEFIMVKRRDTTSNWVVMVKTGPATWVNGNATGGFVVNSTAATTQIGDYDPHFTSTTAQFGLVGGGYENTQAAGGTFVAYLFASCPGVSKVGSYTGTGALQTINCAFTTGARFVMIKRTNSTDNWYVWDSARGISSGNDPYSVLNDFVGQVAGTNYVDTDSTGFKVTAGSPLAINGATYIFLAIA